MSDNKRFEDYPKVDCNDCEPWWLNQCDGAPRGSERRCNSFSATRKVDIPDRLNRLEKRVQRLSTAGLLVAVSVLIQVVLHLMECW